MGLGDQACAAERSYSACAALRFFAPREPPFDRRRSTPEGDRPFGAHASLADCSTLDECDRANPTIGAEIAV